MKPRQLNLFGAKTDKENKLPREGIVIPVDTAILLIVVIILIFVIAFSWGMERGRRLTLGALAKEAGSQKENAKAETLKTKKIGEEEKKEEEKNSKDLKEKRNNVITKKKHKLYRIQVASFYKLSSAKQEAKKLKDKGYSVKIGKKGKYSVVYVGNFNSKKEAEKNLKKLKKTYQDCMLRVSD
ncbi:MAG: SPOR domain-containing protein [Candidatus Omnitrophica bacterium]|nr:SPOR domain-containing protein [Candidatus Omnitrophota bacterium]MCF7876818.1 SPOR domain-containing protein [Candidatus Omnitrophota bacterium]MCF7878113.1 SPOR domain-containing protein [Candidatus Omnitrophota bacterium]MCF7892983.1 SPOR domain-containing protein [Candidatus Omnitrophota bacterium]